MATINPTQVANPEARLPESQQPAQKQVEMAKRVFTLADGRKVSVNAPKDAPAELVMKALYKRGDVETGVSALKRFAARWVEGENITTNLADFAESHVPLGEFAWEKGEGLVWKSPNEIHGEGFMEASPDERRKIINDRRTQWVKKNAELVQIERDLMKQKNEWDVAGVAGTIFKAAVDPAAYPLGAIKAGEVGYKALKGGKSILQAGKQAAVPGAVVGGAFGGSEYLSEHGVPTNMKEAVSFTADTALASGYGATGAFILGSGAAAIPKAYNASKNAAGRALTKYHLSSVEGSKKVADQYEAILAEKILAGKPVKVAAKEARDALYIEKSDVKKLASTRPGGKFKTPTAKERLEKVNERARATADEYQDALDAARADGLPMAEAARRARAEVGLEVSDVIRLRRATPAGKFDVRSPMEAQQALIERKLLSRGATGATEAPRRWYDEVIEPIYSGISKIAPQISHRLRKMEGEVFIKSHDAHSKVASFNGLYRRLKKSDKLRISIAVLNGKADQAMRIMRDAHGEEGVKALQEVYKVLDEIGAELKATGVKFKGKQNYFPRVVRDLNKLKKEMRKRGVDVDDQIAALEKKKGAPLNEVEINKLLNKIIASDNKFKKALASQKRKIDDIDEDLFKYYEDIVSSLDLYIRDSYSTISRRKFFGNSLREAEGNVENMGASIKELLRGTSLTEMQKRNLATMLNARFVGGERRGWRWLNNLRSITSALTLGNPLSASVQLGDIGPVGFLKGVGQVVKTLPRSISETAKGAAGLKTKSGLTADDLGLMRDVVEELQTGGYASTKVRQWSDRLYRYGGFKLIDRLGKNTNILASMSKARAQVKTEKGTAKLVERLSKDGWQADEIGQLISSLKKGETSDIVRQFALSELADIQPISKTEMPQKYLEQPNGRAFYQFLTWGVKQFDLVRKHILADVFSKDPKRSAKGIQSLAFYSLILGSTQIGSREVKRMMLNEESVFTDPDKLPEEAFWVILGNIGFNKFGFDQYITRGQGVSEALNLTIPAFEVGGKIAVDIAQMAYHTSMGDLDAAKNEAAQIAFRDIGMGRFLKRWIYPDATDYGEAPYKKQYKSPY